MARVAKEGVSYFPLDCDFFENQKIRSLRARYGNDGVILYLYIISTIYGNKGYYMVWDTAAVEDIMLALSLSENFINQVMQHLASRSLLRSILAGPVTYLTSERIQHQYMAIKGSSRVKVCQVYEELWLLGEDETKSFVKFTHFPNNYCKNDDNYRNNGNNSWKKAAKEKKGNNKSINTLRCTSEDEPTEEDALEEKSSQEYAEDCFEMRAVDAMIARLLILYPNSKVPKTHKEKCSWCVHIDRLRRLDGKSEQEIKDAMNFALLDPFWQQNIRSTKKFREKFDTLLIKARAKSVGAAQGSSKPNRFHNFDPVEDVDYDEIARRKIEGRRMANG